jgi:hypothetical protein
VTADRHVWPGAKQRASLSGMATAEVSTLRSLLVPPNNAIVMTLPDPVKPHHSQADQATSRRTGTSCLLAWGHVRE